MMRQTGGEACGATSTRSRSAARAIARASGSGLMPTCSPSAETSRTSRARMRSLIRGSLVTGVGMAPLLGLIGSGPTTTPQRGGSGARTRRTWGGRVGPHTQGVARFPVRLSSVGYPDVADSWIPDGEPSALREGLEDESQSELADELAAMQA